MNILLTFHIASGLTLVGLSLSPLLNLNLTKAFYASFGAVALSGVGMILFGTSIASVCVRFIAISAVTISLFVFTRKLQTQHIDK